MSKYPFTTLKDKAIVFSGYAFRSEDFTGNGVPAIKISNIKNGYVDLSDSSTQYLDPYFVKKIPSKFIVGRGDLLVSLTGSHITQPNSVVGRIAKYQHTEISLLNQRAGKITVKNPNEYDLNFLYYYMSTWFVRQEIAQLAHGAANQANVSPKDIEKTKIPLPPLPIQRKIAAILSAYDELIENNNRRITILEKMAEEIYREWFVRLRFPGHEKVKVVKGVPEGWEVKKVGEVYKTSSGGTPSRNNARYYNGNINWLKTGELKNTYTFESEEKIAPEGLENSSAKLYGKNTVVIAMYCAMEDISILAEDASTNQACCAFLPSKINIPYLFTYYQIKFALPHIIAFAHGAAQQNLSQEIIKSYSLFLPHMELIDRFAELVQPLHSEIKSLMLRNMSLKKSRDLLLPRLISGKLDVENLDIAFPPGMEEERS